MNNKKITNVEVGDNDGDVVNFQQLNSYVNAAKVLLNNKITDLTKKVDAIERQITKVLNSHTFYYKQIFEFYASTLDPDEFGRSENNITSFNDLVLNDPKPESEWSLRYGFKNFIGYFDTGIDLNKNWTFFSVVKLLTLNPRATDGDFFVIFGIDINAPPRSTIIQYHVQKKNNGSIEVLYGLRSLWNRQKKTVSYNDLNKKQILIWIIKNGNNLKMSIGGHDYDEINLSPPYTLSSNRAHLHMTDNVYLLRAGVTTNVYGIPSSDEWKNMFYSERKLGTYFGLS